MQFKQLGESLEVRLRTLDEMHSPLRAIAVGVSLGVAVTFGGLLAFAAVLLVLVEVFA